MDSDDDLLLSPAKMLLKPAGRGTPLGTKPISPFVWDSDDEDDDSRNDNDGELPDPLTVLRDVNLNDGARVMSNTPLPTQSDTSVTIKSAVPFHSASSDNEDLESKPRRRSSRPASKKAMQEMHKETQRIERGLALQPAAITTRQIKMEDVLSKFGYRKPIDVRDSMPESQSTLPTLTVEPAPTAVIQSRRLLVPSAHISGSDSDLDILPPTSLESKHSRLAHIVGNSKNNESTRSHLTLLKLSGITSPERLRQCKRRLGRTTIQTVTDPKQLSSELLARASIQAQQMRAAKRAELQDRGIQVMTADERAKEQMDIEDMVERERERDLKLRQEEKALVKKKQTGVTAVENSSGDDSSYSEGADNSDEASSEGDGDNDGEERLGIDLTGAVGASEVVPVLQMETFPFDLEVNSHPLHYTSDSEDEGGLKQSLRQVSFTRHPRVVGSDDEEVQDRVPDSQALPPQDSGVGGLTQFFQSTLRPVNQDAPTQLISAAPDDFSQAIM